MKTEPNKAMEPVLLFVVEESFQISGRGCVLVPGIAPDPTLRNVRVGDAIRLVKPNGEEIETRIHGVEMINYGGRPRPEVIFAPISIPKPLTKQDAPPGTKVFYLGTSA